MPRPARVSNTGPYHKYVHDWNTITTYTKWGRERGQIEQHLQIYANEQAIIINGEQRSIDHCIATSLTAMDMNGNG
jgi:hypothetical protein